jgi:hypothetical protein
LAVVIQCSRFVQAGRTTRFSSYHSYFNCYARRRSYNAALPIILESINNWPKQCRCGCSCQQPKEGRRQPKVACDQIRRKQRLCGRRKNNTKRLRNLERICQLHPSLQIRCSGRLIQSPNNSARWSTDGMQRAVFINLTQASTVTYNHRLNMTSFARGISSGLILFKFNLYM